MQTQYDYAKDNRTDEVYETNTKVGQHNQELAINQFLIDYQIEKRVKLKCYHIKDKDFQGQGGSWEYNADYEIVGETTTPVEVKVQMAPLGDTIDIKASQVNKLGSSGVFLYALKDKYALLKANTIKQSKCIIKSKRFGGKEVYQLETDKINWVRWLHKPDFVNYES